LPRVVDHEERRAQIADAAWRVISRLGIEGASLQSIAAELGSTTGTVSHYFRSKDAIVSFAFEIKTAALFREIERAVDREKPGLPRLRLALARMTPVLTASRATTGPATLSYWGLAVTQPSFAKLHRKSYGQWQALVQRFLREAIATEQIPTKIDVTAEASLLMTFVDGLVVGAVLEPRRVSPKAAALMLDEMIHRLSLVARQAAVKFPLLTQAHSPTER
jgi:AcrR family transcriptional regulator